MISRENTNGDFTSRKTCSLRDNGVTYMKNLRKIKHISFLNDNILGKAIFER